MAQLLQQSRRTTPAMLHRTQYNDRGSWPFPSQIGLRPPAFAFRGIRGTRQAAALVNFNVPLFLYDGGHLNSNKQVALIQADQAVADAEEAKERAETEINQIVIGLNRAAAAQSLPDPNPGSPEPVAG
jgi:hypothetical protein